MELSVNEILAILESGSFDGFVGESESEILECRGQPYALEGDRGRFELAKDLSSFANVQGGFIIIGLETRQDTTSMGEIISRVHPLARHLVDPAQYENVLNSWLFPRPTFWVRWFPLTADPERGLFAIEIAEQNDADKPFLTARLLADDESRLEIAFGYAERKGTSSHPRTVHEMQKFFRDGHVFNDVIEARFEAIEARLVQAAAGTGRLPNVDSAIALAIGALGDQDRRFISLVAQPTMETELRTIFSSGPGTIRSGLERPPEPRAHGWGLRTLSQARIIEGRLIRVVGGRSKVIDLYRSGTLVFSATADGEFYSWGRQTDNPKINSLALIEAIYNFMHFYGQVIADMVRAPDAHSVWLDFGNFHKDSIPSYMMPFSIRSFDQTMGDGERHAAPQAHWRQRLEFTRSEIVDAPSATVYQIVREIYFWFGMEENHIPYTRAAGGTTIIDPALFETT